MTDHNFPVHKMGRLGIHPRERISFLVLGDFIGGVISLGITLLIWANRANEWLDPSLDFLLTRPPWWFYLLPFLWLIFIVDTYNVYRIGNVRATISSTLLSALVGFIVYTVVYFFPSDPGLLPRLGIPMFLGFASLITIGWHISYSRLFAMPLLLRRAVVVGAGRAGQTFFRMMEELAQRPFDVIAVIDDDPPKQGTLFNRVPVVGGSDKLLETVKQYGITDVIVAISGTIEKPMFVELLKVQELGVEIVRMQTIYEELLGRVPIFHQDSDWMLRSFVEYSRASTMYALFKRSVDVLAGLVGLLVLAVISPFIALANLFESGFPVFYTQTRSGELGKPYEVYKFRTMLQDAEKDNRPHWTEVGDPRVTRVGVFLRKTHLDELPQLLNVLRGDMSLVGPRPERPELVEYYQDLVPFYRARLLVKPGITGWAQVHQEYASSIEETNIKLEYDLYYIKHRNMLMELIILLRTPATVFGFRGR